MMTMTTHGASVDDPCDSLHQSHNEETGDIRQHNLTEGAHSSSDCQPGKGTQKAVAGELSSAAEEFGKYKAVIPHPNDVLFGKGTAINAHPGNRRLRSLVDFHRPELILARRWQKRVIAARILEEVRRSDPPGRFLTEDPGGEIVAERGGGVGGEGDVHPAILAKAWVIMFDMERTIVKIMQRMREKNDVGACSKEHRDAAAGLHDVSEAKSMEAIRSSSSLEVSGESGARQKTGEKTGPCDVDGDCGGASFPELKHYAPGKHVGGTFNQKAEGEEQAESFDVELDSLLPDFSSQHDGSSDTRVELQELTLQQWIKRSVSNLNKKTVAGSQLPRNKMPEYATSAAFVALKLTEFLIEAEKEEQNGHGNPIPLASIVAGNVLIRTKELHHNSKEGSSGELGSSVTGGFEAPRRNEVIEYVWIMSRLGDRSNVGGVMSRLFALGVVLYELFSGGEPLLESDIPAFSPSSNSLSMDSVNLADESRGSRPLQKRSQRQSPHIEDKALSHCILKLESKGVPWSVCTLTLNLVDCGNGDLSGDEAYASLADLRLDLGLMTDDPPRFLCDVEPVPAPAPNPRDRLYGRERDTARLEQAHRRHLNGRCGGAIVSGGAGVGKSTLAVRVLRGLADQSGGQLLTAKFDQGGDVRPLSKVGDAFNSLCDSFARDATPAQLESVGMALEGSLGGRAGLLTGIVPVLTRLLPSCAGTETVGDCVDAVLGARFQFGELLSVISSHSTRPISLLLDDIQWADAASLLLVGHLLRRIGGANGSVFFVFCHRDDDIDENGPFAAWLSSASGYALEAIKLENMSDEGVNELVSDALHLSPRITWPLASVLHHKTSGNPLFLRRLIDSLREQNYIYFQMSPPHWAWDLENIAGLKISDDVLTLLIKEIKRLSPELQLGLKVASCIGSCVNYFVLDILSKDLNVNLVGILQQVCNRGFVDNVGGGKFRFAHDKIQQAAYELMTEQMRGENHTWIGLALCAHTLSDSTPNDDLLFTIVTQVNLGGVARVQSKNRKKIVAEMNLKAGRRAIDLVDYSVAFQLFEHGISFLDTDDRWASQYSLSLELFDAAIESACALNDVASVKRLSDEVLDHAKCVDDKLSCLYTTVKSLRVAHRFQDAKTVAFAILKQLGERMPRPSSDTGLAADIQEMKSTLTSFSDEDILNMKETETNKKNKHDLLMNLYHDISFLLELTMDKGKLADSSLRMVQITLSNGICLSSPLAFANFSIVLVSNRDAELGYRVGTLALRLLNKINAHRYTSAVIAITGSLVSWVAEPMQSIAESHLLGYRYGQRNGDIASGNFNCLLYLTVLFLSGQSLHIVREKSRAFTLELLQRKQLFLLAASRCVYLQAVAFIEGLEFRAEEDDPVKFPSWHTITKSAPDKLGIVSHQYMRSFLFKRYDNLPRRYLLDGISVENASLRPVFLYGVFFEGLASFHLARQPDGNEWRRKGQAALAFMKHWCAICSWNFENKKLLLEAELMYISGEYDQAESSYSRSVRSANEHKFVHEEAIASELAATFFHERGLHQKAYVFFVHAVNCFKTWGAFAIASRVENDTQGKLGPCFEPTDKDLMASVLAPTEACLKKRAE